MQPLAADQLRKRNCRAQCLGRVDDRRAIHLYAQCKAEPAHNQNASTATCARLRYAHSGARPTASESILPIPGGPLACSRNRS